MKTTVNYNKNIIRIALLLATILFSPGMYAQKSFNALESLKVSDIFLRSSNEIISEISSTFKTDVFLEDQLSLEDWMMDLDKFAEKNNHNKYSEIIKEEVFNEPKLEMDEWMMESDWNYIKKENFKEDTLRLEKWMCNPRNWIL